jgi:hypothetical protein
LVKISIQRLHASDVERKRKLAVADLEKVLLGGRAMNDGVPVDELPAVNPLGGACVTRNYRRQQA